MKHRWTEKHDIKIVIKKVKHNFNYIIINEIVNESESIKYNKKS